MQKLVPITRLGKFFGGEDYALDINMGSEWLIGDMNFTVVLYRVDRYKTKADDVYGEAVKDGIQFMTPIELKGYVQIMAPTNQKIGNTKVRYYSVADDGRVVSDNKHTYGGYRPFYRTIIATPVNENEFRGI